MADKEITTFQKIKSSIVPILFNILLPIWDVFSDARITVILFVGGYKCKDFYDDWDKCKDGPTIYCNSSSANQYVCEETFSGFICNDRYAGWETCRDNPMSYCTNSNSNNTTNHELCETKNHPWFGVMLLLPFLLNYFASFITWSRLDNNKKITFIFPLLNLYAPYGKSFLFIN